MAGSQAATRTQTQSEAGLKWERREHLTVWRLNA